MTFRGYYIIIFWYRDLHGDGQADSGSGCTKVTRNNTPLSSPPNGSNANAFFVFHFNDDTVDFFHSFRISLSIADYFRRWNIDILLPLQGEKAIEVKIVAYCINPHSGF